MLRCVARGSGNRSPRRFLRVDEAVAGLRGRGKLGALWVWDEAG